MKKLRVYGVRARVCLLALCLVLAGSAEAAQTVIRINSVSNPQASPDMPSLHWYLKFAETMKAKLGDKVDVKIYWDNQLAKTYADGINGTQNQTLQMCNIPAASMAEYTKALIPLNGLYVVPYPRNQIVRDAFAGDLGEHIRDQIVQETGLRIVSFWDFGFRYILTAKKPVTKVEDLAGMKFRCQPNPVQLAAFKAYGTNPTPITYSELFTSLQQGVIDGTENPLVNVYQSRLYEVTKYFTKTGHILEFNVCLVNEDWYRNLPEDVRKAFDESVIEADAAFIAQFEKAESNFMTIVEEKMEVFDVSPEETEKFFKIGQASSKEEIVRQVGEEYYTYFMGELEKARIALDK
ncbi:MAG: TRAP transporter substrate-binding protein [Synergistaceae bacterium]|jgi:tripartite ATP-independent transporter DctP family solute receptor|nr:TRAP transporter substrate-binding protein [Synergistaceae bacterium]